MPSKRCAACGERPVLAVHAPFCSEGCRARDLNRWLSEAYVLPPPSEADELAADAFSLANGLDKPPPTA
jgi:endogenous inhibitor of DNA gyrase (YacG/DUF329 family)